MTELLLRGRTFAEISFRTATLSLFLVSSIAFLTSPALARDTIRGNSSTSVSSRSGTSDAASQTATAATAATAQAAQAAITARRAQDSFIHAATAFQNAQSAQAAAALAAQATVPDGLGVGGLNPVGGATTSSTGPAIQIIELSSGSKNQLALGGSGSVTLPSGTPGSDQITVTGAGSVTSAGGTVTTSAGSVTTTTGGTLAAMNGGTISLTAGSGTLSVTTSTTLTSTLPGTVTLTAGGGTVPLAANQTVTVPAGSSITFSGSSAGTVNVTGAGTVTLSGAGTLALANAAAAAAGGTITTNSGTTSFTSGGSISSLAAGSQINVVGSGTIGLTGTTNGSTAVTLPLILSSASSFTTTGTALTTQGYNLPTSWTGISALSQSTGQGLTTVTITQAAQEALLYWTTFNVGKSTLLDFDQSAGGPNVGTWVAVNQIEESSLAPSQILGSIEAPGQVYVINQNGIIFGGSSQVNVHALVASSLPINTNLVTPEDLLGGSSTDDQFLFSQVPVTQVGGVANALPTFNPPAAPSGGDGDVTVQAGAELSSPTTPEHVGGKIALIGPVVDNEGTISTPDGQTILAAGLQVGFAPHDATDPSVRGLDVFVGQVGTATDANDVADGTVTNGGLIDSPRADITLTGMNVNQDGIISSLTSVALNGRIDLLADYGATVTVSGSGQPIITPTETGNVTLGANSLTEILPDSTGATVVGTSLALPSLVNIEGGTINFEGATDSGAGALLLAPGAQATAPSTESGSASDGTVDLTGAPLTSGVNLTAGSWVSLTGVSVPVLTPTSGQVNIGSGATIDVSGSQDVSASVTENIIAVQLRGTELADSPLQQNGPLRGQTVYVDIAQSGVYDGNAWIGSPIGDLSGYAALAQHTVNELTVNGGTVGIEAGGGVNIAAGSTINVSGGWINYQGADVQTTKVVTAAGQILDIADATPDQVYQGIYSGFTQTSTKWGVTQTFNDTLESTTTYEPSYVQGGNGGALTISTPSLSLQGNLYGNTVAGVNQVTPTTTIATGNIGAVTNGLPQFANATFNGSNFMPILLPIDAAPLSSSLVLNLFSQIVTTGQTPTIRPEDVVFQPSSGPAAANPYAGSGNQELDLSADLVNVDGFGNLTIEGNVPTSNNYNDASASAVSVLNTTGNIALPAGVALITEPRGSITLASVNIDVEGSILAPGGNLSFTTQNLESSESAGATSPLEAVSGRGDFTLGAGALLSSAGLIVDNEAGSPFANTLPQVTNSGNIIIQSLNANLELGSSIDASGGALISTAGKTSYGAAGKIEIEAGEDSSPGSAYGIVGGNLILGSTLSADSGRSGGGGTLAIVAPAIQVGGSVLENGDSSGDPVQESSLVWGDGTTLWLDRTGSSDFFSQGGFSTFSVTGLGLAPITYTAGAATSLDPYASTPGVLIAPGTTLKPLVQSYELVEDGGGVDLAPTTYSLASQRNPVNLSFNASGVKATVFQPSILVVRGDLVMGAGADIETDPLGSVTLSGQTVTVLGQVYAPGGTIKVTGANDSINLFNSNTSTVYSASDISPTVDLAAGSVLSTAGTAEQTLNSFGYDTGNVLPGGNITVSGNIVAEENSVLNVSGTSATFDVAPGAAGVTVSALSPERLIPTLEESNAGSITFSGKEELFVDSTLIGQAGGASAQAGSLSISNGFSNYSVANPDVAVVQGTQDATLIVTQSGPTRASSLTGQAVIGQQVTPSEPMTDVDGDAILGYFAADTNIFSRTIVDPASGNNGGVAGGIGSLTLNGTVQFSGPVSINTSAKLIVGTNPASANSFIVSGGVIYADAPVTLTSAYVSLGLPFGGPDGKVTPSEPVSGSGSLTVDASTLIDVGDLSLENMDQLALNSSGDVRGDGALNVAGNISITAAQIYPTTESTFSIAAFDSLSGSSSVTLATAAGNLPSLPLSAGGTLDIYADTITQGGVLRAPMGTINLGSLAPPSGSGLPVTEHVTLSAGSITSVSAVDPTTGLGMTIPYGTIDDNGNWIDPAGNTITAGSTPTLPAKAINISATNINDISGSTLDIQGGGDLMAAQFVPGTGGTNDILASTASFAILPAVNESSYAPFDTDSGYATSGYSNLQVGDQVYLAASNGLAAGYYTLLPARYALLPGAFLVTPKSGTPSGTSVTEPDGSVLVSGYRASSLNGAQEQPLTTLFEVDSQAVIKAQAEYVISSANTYFPQSAASLSVATPRLPVDAGQVVFDATQSLTIPSSTGTLLGQAGAGGLGGIVDIASPTPINIYNSGNSATPAVAGDLNLDASALDSFGADSLLIGGFRTVTSSGTQVTVSNDSLTVNNAGAPLIGPDIILVSNDTLTVGANAAIESIPGSSVVAPLLQLSGDGTALRVSSDSSAQIVRSDVTANTAGPGLGIGALAFIGSTTGSGSVILDSTSAASLDPQASLSAQSVALNSGQISLVLPDLASTITTTLQGLVLSSTTLSNLELTAQNFSLLSYSSLDIWGSGNIGASPDASGVYAVQSLTLHAAEVRGFDNGGNAVDVNAQNVVLNNSPNGTGLGPMPGYTATGTLAINSDTITLGINPLAIDQYAQVTLSASNAIVLSNGTGSLATAGNLTLSTPLLTVSPITPLTPLQELDGQTPPTATTQTICAGGALTITNPGGAIPALAEGLGANVTLAGTSVTVNSNVQLPSGTLAMVATSGDLSVGGNLDVGGTQQNIYSLTEYTSGGQISLASYTGAVSLNTGSTVNVSAQPGGGNAGSLTISAPEGTFSFAGSAMLGQGGEGGQGGTFSLDAASLAGSNLSPLEEALNPVVSGAKAGDTYLGGFTQSQTIRLRTGDVTVDGTTATDTFNLSTDTGSIIVSGEIASNSGQTDASGASTASIDVTTGANSNGTTVLSDPGMTGGSINLEANGSVTLLSGSLLSVAAQTINDAGEGGTVTLEAGDETNGIEPSTGQSRDATTLRFTGAPVVDIQTGSVIDLSVAATGKMFDGSEITGTTGTLDLRAPQTSSNTDVQIDPINGTIVNPSSIVVEGYQVFTATDGSIDEQEAAVMTNGNTFAGIAGQPATASYTAMLNALISSTGVNRSLLGLTTVEPGAEIINPNGDLTLAGNWDLSTYRFGPNDVAGDLTLRASGNLVFDFGASLSDGFVANPNSNLAAYGLWTDVLMPAGSQSWSYRLVSGADFGAADYQMVLPLSAADSLVASTPDALAANSGSVVVGMNTPINALTGLSTLDIMSTFNGGLGYYQTIRTGTGNIDIASGRDVQLLNNVATIYTAGTQSSSLVGFQTPNLNDPKVNGNDNYNYPLVGGTVAQAQYSQKGGNLTIFAQGNIAHYAAYNATSGLPIVADDINGDPLMEDSSLELPTNWLYRRGYDNGGSFGTNVDGQIASTTWWIDFSNFFEGVGALGGGNVAVIAGGNISNVDAVVPTNARMPGTNASGVLISPSAGSMVESGGGDLVVSAGNNIDGGVYYVERGQATVEAGNQITTNATRNVVSVTASSETDLPTTFYLGKGSINVSAGSDLLLGPVVNAFLLPQGINNTVNDKSYFSTYASSDTFTASSLTGTVTIRDAFASTPTDSVLVDFYADQLSNGSQSDFSSSAPWLGLIETNISPFDAVLSLLPPTLDVTAFSGDINLAGNLTLSPSPIGTVDLVAAGSLNAFQPISVGPTGTVSWGSSQINLSDANPNSIPGITTPLSYAPNSRQRISLATTYAALFNPINDLFDVSGSTDGTYALLTTQEELHADLPIDPSDPNSALGPLHAADSKPVYLYAATGDIDGLNLFSGKFADVVAGNDITDISLYVQNINSTDITLVEAGGDIIPYNADSLLREETHATGGIYLDENDNASNPSTYFPQGSGAGAPNAGDLQIAGPGTLEVLAGGNLELGDGPNNGDGTGLGIVTIGNTVNPYLTFNGADIIAAAGLGGSGLAVSNRGAAGFGLDPSNNSTLNFTDAAGTGFTDLFLNPVSGGAEAARYLPDLGNLLGVSGVTNGQIWNIFSGTPDTSLTTQEQAIQAQLTPESRDALALTLFYDVLRDAGRDHNNPSSPNAGTYTEGYAALEALFPASRTYQGDISLTSREIKTTNGGNISLLAPGGEIDVGLNNSGTQAIDQGILTVDGGNISIFARNSVSVGTSRIFTLHGGNEIIWSTLGNIDAGASSKTVQSAPPTRVLVDTQSGDVETDLAGLATGGGIGVLETIVGAPPGDVDLIAPSGIVDAGDAGIRSSGNINIAATQVLNAGNIQSGGASTGVAPVAAPNISATVAASTAGGASQNAAGEAARQQQPTQSQPEDLPSIISVQVIGYGGGDDDSASTSPSATDKLGVPNGEG
jgi:filamentous hemagglutinin family protein